MPVVVVVADVYAADFVRRVCFAHGQGNDDEREEFYSRLHRHSS